MRLVLFTLLLTWPRLPLRLPVLLRVLLWAGVPEAGLEGVAQGGLPGTHCISIRQGKEKEVASAHVMPPKRAARLTHRVQHRQVSAAPVGRPPTAVQRPPRLTREQQHQLMWQDDYWPLLEAMLAETPSLVAAVEEHLRQHSSRCVQRLEGEALRWHLWRNQFKLCNLVSLTRSLGHSQSTTVFKMADSIAALKQCVTWKRWKIDMG